MALYNIMYSNVNTFLDALTETYCVESLTPDAWTHLKYGTSTFLQHTHITLQGPAFNAGTGLKCSKDKKESWKTAMKKN